jgi:hypothetical protein
MKRASRTGLLALMKDGMVFFASSSVATATCGLTAGLVPPTAGWAWHPERQSVVAARWRIVREEQPFHSLARRYR